MAGDCKREYPGHPKLNTSTVEEGNHRQISVNDLGEAFFSFTHRDLLRKAVGGLPKVLRATTNQSEPGAATAAERQPGWIR